MKASIPSAILGVILILVILGDAFETIVFPRRVTRRVRLARLFYRYTWKLWSGLVTSLSSGRPQESYLSFYGPLSLLLLLVLWATGLIVGFGLLLRALGATREAGFGTSLYLSGTTFFTLGIGDVVPYSPLGRAVTAVEAGTGFAFLALIIGYLPALNQSFARRELNISLLDARAGSPPAATEMLRRHNYDHGMDALQQFLHEWERWSADFLEAHLSYPVLAYFRSQHDNQSWLAALTTILDTCALVIVGWEGACVRQAELTFAMARHAIVDLSIIFSTAPLKPEPDRLPPSDLASLRAILTAAGLQLREGGEAEQKLTELRRMYEPYVYSLSRYLRISLPPWIAEAGRTDNWQTSAWGRISNFRRADKKERVEEKHF